MHIARDSLVMVSEGEPFGGQVGRVQNIKIFYEQGRAPRVFAFVYLLLAGHTVPFEPHQIKLRSNNDHEIMAHMMMEPEPLKVAA